MLYQKFGNIGEVYQLSPIRLTVLPSGDQKSEKIPKYHQTTHEQRKKNKK